MSVQRSECFSDDLFNFFPLSSRAPRREGESPDASALETVTLRLILTLVKTIKWEVFHSKMRCSHIVSTEWQIGLFQADEMHRFFIAFHAWRSIALIVLSVHSFAVTHKGLVGMPIKTEWLLSRNASKTLIKPVEWIRVERFDDVRCWPVLRASVRELLTFPHREQKNFQQAYRVANHCSEDSQGITSHATRCLKTQSHRNDRKG